MPENVRKLSVSDGCWRELCGQRSVVPDASHILRAGGGWSGTSEAEAEAAEESQGVKSNCGESSESSFPDGPVELKALSVPATSTIFYHILPYYAMLLYC